MIDSLDEAKASLRRSVRAKLLNLAPTDRVAASASLWTRLYDQIAWSNARCVLLFAPFLEEPDIWPLLSHGIAAGKAVALPAFDAGTGRYTARQIIEPSRDLVLGKFGIREPMASCPELPLNRLDLALVPGVAFDTRGGRLGRGKGFYDRLLPAVNGLKCGVAFDEQIVDAVPVGPMDVRLNCIVTPTRWIEA